MAKHFVWIVLIFLIFLSCCGRSVRNNTTYYSSGDNLYRQRILNSTNVLYKYENFGKYAWSNWHFGTFIMDSTKYIRQTHIEDLLPFSLVYLYNMRLTPDSLSKEQKISDYGVYKKFNKDNRKISTSE